jgi:beta-lactamase regulating signal transducer with metallopeptidase domain
MMSPELSLHFAAIFLSYFLKVAAAYLVCRLLNRLLREPRQRFVMWAVFLLGAGTYWLELIWSQIRASPSTAEAVAGTMGRFGATAASHSFLVPLGWRHAILITGQVLGLAYGSAALLLIAVAALQHLRLRLLLRRAMEPSAALAGLFRETCRDFAVSRARLVVLPGLRSPATACWWNPRILLPEGCEELGPTPQVADVLAHELVHVARRIYFWAGVSDLVSRLLFFHPAVWSARKWMCL